MSATAPRRIGARVLASVVLFAGAAVLGACASPPRPLQPFTTDGCSLFPDRAPIGKADWCHCCVEHDLAYWRGGTADARLAADRALQACVRDKTGDAALADLMYAGVRAGGGPYFYTWYRWGYGWSYGRGYAPLTAAEQTLADALEREYRAKDPELRCPR